MYFKDKILPSFLQYVFALQEIETIKVDVDQFVRVMHVNYESEHV